MSKTSFKDKYHELEDWLRMREAGTRTGLRIYDGLLHELGHLVVLGVPAQELLTLKKSRTFWFEGYVMDKVRACDSDKDLDECKTTVACVHVLRRMRMMKDTGRYVRSSLRAAKDLSVNPKALPGHVERLLRDPAMKELGNQLWDMVHELYDHAT